MRIELLDPRWKSQRDALESRKAQASELQRGANVVSSLKNLARTRVDIFGAEADEERRKKEEEEERERRKEREKVVWDGHTASKANTLDKFSSNVNFDEQIAAIHRAKGLGPYVPICLSFTLKADHNSQARCCSHRPWYRARHSTSAIDVPASCSSLPSGTSTPSRLVCRRSCILRRNHLSRPSASVNIFKPARAGHAPHTALPRSGRTAAVRLSASACTDSRRGEHAPLSLGCACCESPTSASWAGAVSG